MTVKELKEKLKEYNDDDSVVIDDLVYMPDSDTTQTQIGCVLKINSKE